MNDWFDFADWSFRDYKFAILFTLLVLCLVYAVIYNWKLKRKKEAAKQVAMGGDFGLSNNDLGLLGDDEINIITDHVSGLYFVFHQARERLDFEPIESMLSERFYLAQQNEADRLRQKNVRNVTTDHHLDTVILLEYKKYLDESKARVALLLEGSGTQKMINKSNEIIHQHPGDDICELWFLVRRKGQWVLDQIVQSPSLETISALNSESD